MLNPLSSLQESLPSFLLYWHVKICVVPQRFDLKITFLRRCSAPHVKIIDSQKITCNCSMHMTFEPQASDYLRARMLYSPFSDLSLSPVF